MSLETYGEYQLLKKLATGGMAQIYLARARGVEGFEKLLVVKRILPHLAENDEFIKMFLDEARIAARLNHPNVVQIFNLGAIDDSFFIAMEYIHGEDVRRVWKRADAAGKPLPVPLVCRIIMDACAGLDYAHKKTDNAGKPLTIVHRDISPQNILVTFEGGVKVVDFGIAKAADQATVTKSGVLKGKYSYMSPEQASGQKIDARSDIFALGVVLYELLTGTRLFKRANDIQTLNAVTECEVTPPSLVNSRLPADLDPIVMKALARLPQDRFQEARDLQAALEDWLLKNQLPSSSVHLANFLQDIYADRLAKEAEEGRFLIESLDSSRGEQDLFNKQATPASKPGTHGNKATPKPTVSQRAIPDRGGKDEEPEVTVAQRGTSRTGATSKPRSLDKVLEEQERQQERERIAARAVTGEMSISVTQARSRSTAVPLVVIAAIVLVGVGGFFAFRPAAAARVRVDSEPSGAQVMLAGKGLGKTPLTLPELPPGNVTLRLTKEGFETAELQIAIPDHGELTVPVFKLSASAAVSPPLHEADAGAGTAQVVEAPPELRPEIVFKTTPPGAQVVLNGRVSGATPLTLPLDEKKEVKVTFRLSGFKELTDTFSPTHDETRAYTLEKEKRVAQPVRDPPPVVRNDPPPQQAAPGRVRFIVKPWATVTCGSRKLGDTPFADWEAPAGSYQCTLDQPDMDLKKTVTVVVKPNELVKVPVNFP